MDYYQFTAEDFAVDDYFKEWVLTPTPRSEAFWREFLAEYPERYYQVEEARRLVEGLGTIHQDVLSATQVNHVWTRIEGTLASIERESPGRWLSKQQFWQLAASVALLLALGWMLRSYRPTNEPGLASYPSKQQHEWIDTVNEAEKTMLLKLSDGSRIQLSKHSRLKYPKDFTGSTREVYLTGEAFFDIQKNPKKPFLVYTNGLITKVLGTSFQVQAPLYSPNVTVSVKSGRVSVYADKSNPTQDPEAEGVVLTPNQKAVFQRPEATISKSLVEKPILLIPKSQKNLFAFEDASAHHVFESLEKAYGIDVVFDEELLRNCSLTVNLTEEDLYQKLKVICKVLGAEYKVIDGQVIIYSKGC
ncbi:FecR family protein [Salmonirosea aquatica]|uniref:DUF4974 domain-containing protein n=1 Tax=Salmonirosea aquatica TaxID=2654236 RepID=A0A7C9BK41_9BACT|nr:DUF4974 domain-containing protein [Cytophagaceae bacterium SJW1-29]